MAKSATLRRVQPIALRSDRAAVLIAVGANVAGRFGAPAEAVARAVALLGSDVKIGRTSAIYKSSPVGGGWQPAYLNALVAARYEGGPSRLLAILKRIERAAGRRPGRKWGPRALDLDIIDHGGRRVGSWRSGRRAPLVLPHPLAHRRAFVLVPLAEIAPTWRHPMLGMTGRQLLQRLRSSERKQVRECGAFHSTGQQAACYERPTQKH